MLASLSPPNALTLLAFFQNLFPFTSVTAREFETSRIYGVHHYYVTLAKLHVRISVVPEFSLATCTSPRTCSSSFSLPKGDPLVDSAVVSEPRTSHSSTSSISNCVDSSEVWWGATFGTVRGCREPGLSFNKRRTSKR